MFQPSLRLRLTLSFAALILVLGGAAAFGLRALTTDLQAAVGETATRVGRSLLTVLRHERIDTGHPADAGAAKTVHKQVHENVRMIVDGRELTPEEIAAVRPPADGAGGDVRIEVVRSNDDPPMLFLHGQGMQQAIPLPQSGVDAAVDRFSRQLGWGLLALLVIGLLGAAWIAQRVAAPLRALAHAARSVGGGALGVQVAESGPPEVRQSIAAFNRMSADLARLDAEASALRADRELAELGEIGRGLAHSLRNPLHALGLSLEALAAQAPEPARGTALAQAGREQLQRIDQALRGFLALAAGAGAAAEPVALRDIVDDVLLEAAQRAQGRVRFECDCAHVVLPGVPAELRILLHTLVMNALEASPDGDVVRVRVAALPGAVAIDVEDRGRGIDASVRQRLFQPHVSTKPHGAGMGLYLSERLARQRYRGRLELHAAQPHGTLARLHLHAREVGDGR